MISNLQVLISLSLRGGTVEEIVDSSISLPTSMTGSLQDDSIVSLSLFFYHMGISN